MEMAVRHTSRIKSLVLVSPAGIAAPGARPADIFLMAPEELVRNLFVDQKLADARLALPGTSTSRSRTAIRPRGSRGSRGCTTPISASGCTVSTCR
jgi:hypothetical protein